MSRFIDSATVGKMLCTDAHLDYLSNSAKEMFSTMRAELPSSLRVQDEAKAAQAANASRKQTPGLSMCACPACAIWAEDAFGIAAGSMAAHEFFRASVSAKCVSPMGMAVHGA